MNVVCKLTTANVLGWAMACNAYLFLDRTFDQDEAHMDNVVEYYAHSGGKRNTFTRINLKKAL